MGKVNEGPWDEKQKALKAKTTKTVERNKQANKHGIDAGARMKLPSIKEEELAEGGPTIRPPWQKGGTEVKGSDVAAAAGRPASDGKNNAVASGTISSKKLKEVIAETVVKFCAENNVTLEEIFNVQPQSMNLAESLSKRTKQLSELLLEKLGKCK